LICGRPDKKGNEVQKMTDNFPRRNTSFDVLYLLTTITVLIALTLLPLSRVLMAFPLERIQKGEGIALKGRVAAVERGKYLTALTVRSGGIPGTGRFPHAQMKVFINPNSMVKMCNIITRAKDIKAGSNVIIAYHRVRVLAVADSASESADR
jgi:uncharacterized membrane protein